ncbi:hypothetical protein ABT093_09560 [Kitasatospora sp. NPDC002551]|uniref:hypothetical protein n=1 Tax=Kitasatospora sp. NPDC002551 TaxID=3154539 RepID=UPI0033304F1C
MSVAGGTPVPQAADEDRNELGRCGACGAWTRGRYIRDLTAHTALVEHCLPAGEEPLALRIAFAVSIGLLLAVIAFLIISGIRH